MTETTTAAPTIERQIELDPAYEWIVMTHPELEGSPRSTVTRAAFDSVWASRGWVHAPEEVLVVTNFEAPDRDVVAVSKAHAGSVYFAGGASITWIEDGQIIDVPREYADALRQEGGEFAFDGTVAEKADPAVEPAPADEPAPAEPVTETAAQKRARLAAEAETAKAAEAEAATTAS